MMRLHNRQVKAAFWQDTELIRSLNRDGRLFYEGLWQLADDSGCLEDDPFAFKIHLFPGDMDITPEVLAGYKDILVGIGKLIPYEAQGKRCLYLKNFHKHQTLDNPSPPLVPLPPWIDWGVYPSNNRKGKYTVRDYSAYTGALDLQQPYNPLTDALQNRSNQNQNLNLNQNQIIYSSAPCGADVSDEAPAVIPLNGGGAQDNDPGNSDVTQEEKPEASGDGVGGQGSGEVDEVEDGVEPGTSTRGKAGERGQPKKEYPDVFESFWAKYPRRIEKKAAYRAWNTTLKRKPEPGEDKLQAADLIRAAENYAEYCKNVSNPRFIKHATTFLGPDKPYEEFVKGVPKERQGAVPVKAGFKPPNMTNTEERQYDKEYYDRIYAAMEN